MCLSGPYTLPQIQFVGGALQKYAFDVFLKTENDPFGMNGYTANFSVSDYANQSTTLLSKQMTVSDNRLTVTLSTDETADWHGKYIYQVSVIDAAGNAEPNQGILFVYKNIDTQLT